MLKQKITVRVKCDDCGATRKEQAQYGDGFWGIVEHLREKGWHLPPNDSIQKEPCYCPTCAEQRDREGGAS